MKNIRNKRLIYFLLFISILAIFLRFFHLPERLYFIYDQGRDAIKLREIVGGNLTLVGPTSGLSGFYLGPLWYYAGVPGYILSNGNPYLLSSWYILLGIIALPLFWLISNKLFKYPWNIVSFLLLCLIPGSIHRSILIWNPLLSIPLLAGSFFAFLQARQSRVALFLGFLLLALTLQSEFAYAIFFIFPLVIFIPWLRQKIDWRDFIVSICAIAITLIPQFVFELKNNFLLTQSLFSGVFGKTDAGINIFDLWKFRPQQLFEVSSQLLIGYPKNGSVWMIPIVLSLIAAIAFIFYKTNLKDIIYPSSKLQSLILLLLFFALPYVGYLFWSGNQGNFFDYYLTPHFIFIVPLLVLGWSWLWNINYSLLAKITAKSIVLISSLILLVSIIKYTKDFIVSPINNAGLLSMEQAIIQLYDWKNKSGDNSNSILVFTPAYQNEQYDYLIFWYANKLNDTLPSSVRTGDENNWFLIMEKNDSDISKFRFKEWYPQATLNGTLVEKKQIGVLELEWWQKN